MLVRIKLRANLKYASWRLPGAQHIAWLQRETHEQLLFADALIRKWTNGHAEILVWDAGRSFETQQHLFNQELANAAAKHPEMDPRALVEHVSHFVRPPRRDMPPPHCTGGAVDVTLLVDGNDNLLGRFDDFEETGHADYYDRHPPATDAEREECRLRRLLDMAMKKSGFVGIPNEFWHFEFGTVLWSEITGQPVRFNHIVEAPQSDAIAVGLAQFPPRQLVTYHGVAHFFPSVEARVSALNGANSGFYYARTRHPNERQLAAVIGELLDVEDAVLMPSGLSAAVATVAALVPKGGCALVDSASYYETRASLLGVAKAVGWKALMIDFDDHAAVDKALMSPVDVIFCDHPRNWLLTLPDLEFLRQRAEEHDATLIVDTSVQPTQRLTDLGLADLMVASLSKYPSIGETVAGAIMGSHAELAAIQDWTRMHGMVLAPEPAATVLRHLPGLADRMHAVSTKATEIGQFLRTRDQIGEVRLPDLTRVNAECGGQLTCRFTSPAFAERVEAVVGWNTGIGHRFPLGLACTFGAAATTFEHFGSRRSGDDMPVPGADVIGPGWVRIGVGLEPASEIIAALRFTIDAAAEDEVPA